MSLKLKALGLSLIAAMAVSAVAVMNASATAGGHFVSEVAHTVVKGTEGPGTAHRHHLTLHGFSGQVGCDEATYEATANALTVTSLTVTPKYNNCYTTGDPDQNAIGVTMNGCTYTFTVAPGPAATTEHTVDLLCPVGKKIEVHHPNCTATIGPQTVKGVTYTRKITEAENTKSHSTRT